MNKTSSLIAILIASVGGFAVGHMVGKRSADDSGATTGAAVAVLEGDGLGERGEAHPEAGDVPRTRVPVTKDQPIRGPVDAPITIVAFSEFRCPFCNRVNPTIEQLFEDYGDNIRLIFRNTPFQPGAQGASNAALEAFEQGGSEAFWKMHDKLFANQSQLTPENFVKWAGEIGIDAEKVREAVANDKHADKINADKALGAKVGARGTPNFFINGRQLVGAQPVERFKEIIDDELKRAEALMKKGIERKDVYAALLRGASEGAAAAEPSRPAAQRPDPAAVYKVELAGDEPQRGPNDALVTIVAVSNFQCGFCNRVLPTLKQIEETYGKDVRIVWWNNLLRFPHAAAAATLALEAKAQKGDAKFWEVHDTLFENQRSINPENIEKWAKEAGLNVAQVKKAIETNKYDAVFKDQMAKASRLGAGGTPAFFINGRFMSGAQPFPSFKSVIDEELARAKKIVESGTPRARVYAEAIKDGATTPQMIGGGDAPARPSQPAPDQRYEIPIPAGAPSIGPANAPVVIQEFSDYQCPFCARVLPTVDQIMEEYKGKVRLVWRDLPLDFHPQANPAAQAAREVYRQGGNEKFWAYNKLLFANYSQLSRAKFEELAEQLGGINMAEFRKALDTERHKPAVDADFKAARDSGARIGTPAFFINGRLVSGAQPFENFKRVIDEELAKK